MTDAPSALDRVAAEIEFVLELDRAKTIIRQNDLVDGSRRENDAEHMWHLAVMAMVLVEHSTEAVDLGRVIGMLLVHDIVEIDAGDVFVYDDAARAAKASDELRAADRIYAILPPDQGAVLRGLWEEFEAGSTAEARFAKALDRLQPLLLNTASGGAAWTRHGITADRVLARNAPIGDAAPALWAVARRRIEESVAGGDLAPAP